MLDTIKRCIFGVPSLPVASADSLPHESREAYHHLMNVAMRSKKVANDIDNRSNDLIEELAKDLRRRSK